MEQPVPRLLSVSIRVLTVVLAANATEATTAPRAAIEIELARNTARQREVNDRWWLPSVSPLLRAVSV